MNDEKYLMAKAFINDSAIPSFGAEEAKSVAEICAIWNESVCDDHVGYVAVYGALGVGYWDSYFTNYSGIKANIEQLLNDKDVNSIILCINSPGGSAAGLFDTCRYIKNACKEKPIYAYVDGMACSAAYAIACACDKIYVSEGSDVGCCGCYCHALEYSDDFYKEKGLLSRVFRSKNAPRKNLSIITNEEEAKAYQEEIDMLGDKYLEMVAEYRNVDKAFAEENFGKGATIADLELAKKNQMIDEIGSLNSCLTTLKSSLSQEGEGDDMDIKEMSAEQLLSEMTDEQKSAIQASLCTSNPSLTDEERNEVRKAERERLSSLNALRDGSASVDALVDEAVENGKDARDIALDVVKAMKEAPKTNESAKANLQALADATEQVDVPSATKSEDQLVAEMANRINEERNTK